MGIVLIGIARILVGGMNHTAIWLVAIKIGYEKSQDPRGGSDSGRNTVESVPLRRRVMNDMTIVDTLLDLLLCAQIGPHPLPHDGALVLHQPHRIKTYGDKEGQNGNQRSKEVVLVDTAITHTSVGVENARGARRCERHLQQCVDCRGCVSTGEERQTWEGVLVCWWSCEVR